jgi:UDP-N-acetylglucosamine:LPS N-acetylglucosamine transferase
MGSNASMTPQSQAIQFEGGPRLLAIASGGGHWVQLLRLRPAFEGAQVLYITVNRAYRDDVAGEAFKTIPDATRWNRFKLLAMGVRLAWIMVRFRPQVVVTTGAAPGYFGIRLGKLMRARTLWIDSIANIDQLSMSGEMACKHATAVFTQWSHLAPGYPDSASEPAPAVLRGPQFQGAVI